MMLRFKSVYRTGLSIHAQFQVRYSSILVKAEWKKRRNIIFNNEVERIKSEIGRIKLMKVRFIPPANEDKVIEICMKKHLSTPHDCTKHISEAVKDTAALALVDDAPWDMHRPLDNDCDLKVLTMQMAQASSALNPAFWRTCSFVMGAMIESSFKDDIQMYLHSFPRPNIKSGSFVYDVVLDLPDWKPTKSELRAMSAQFVKILNESHPIERLEVSEEVALDMFQDNPYKSKQIPDIAKMTNDGKLTLYRIGDHIDISRGPMVGNTNIIGKTTIASVHKFESEETDRMYRFQGVALPKGTMLNHFAFGILEDRARKLNTTVWIPKNISEDLDEKPSLIAQN